MKVYEAIAQGLVAEGCDKMFGLMGDGNMWLWGALGRNREVRFYSARHEAAAISMADGYARVTGRVGAATITCGPGLTHAATPLVAAARHRSPLVILAGEVSARDRHNPQIFDQRGFAEACEARFVRLTSTDGFDPRRLRRALSRAMPRDAVVTCGSTQFWGFQIMHFALPEGGRIHRRLRRDRGQPPIGIGVSAGAPDRPQVVIEGDGSLMQHLQELETVVRCGLQLAIATSSISSERKIKRRSCAAAKVSTKAAWVRLHSRCNREARAEPAETNT